MIKARYQPSFPDSRAYAGIRKYVITIIEYYSDGVIRRNTDFYIVKGTASHELCFLAIKNSELDWHTETLNSFLSSYPSQYLESLIKINMIKRGKLIAKKYWPNTPWKR